MSEINKRKLIVETSRFLVDSKLSPIRSGNISIRHEKKNVSGLLISPSGKKNCSLRTSDVVFVDLKGHYDKKLQKPSSETKFHIALYKNYSCNSVVHVHSKYSVILSCLYKKIPAFHYMIALAGGKDIKTAKYAIYGSEELSVNISQAIKKRRACLIANHGQISIGNSIEEALELAQEVELLCEYYYKCKLIKDPNLLGDNEMKKVLNKFDDYKSN